MKVQEIMFAIQKEGGTVTRVGKSAIYQPKTDFKGNGNAAVPHEDIPKNGHVGEGSGGSGKWNRY